MLHAAAACGFEARLAGSGGSEGGRAGYPAAVQDRTLTLVDCDVPAEVASRVGEEIDRLLSQGLTLADIGTVSLRGQTAASPTPAARKPRPLLSVP